MGGKTLYLNPNYQSPSVLRQLKNEKFKKIQKLKTDKV